MKNMQLNIAKPILLSALVAVGMLLSLSVRAEWVEVTGKATISKGQKDVARVKAREDGLRQAVLQFGSDVRSRQTMENGVLIDDYMSVSSQARVNRAVVVEEYVWADMLYMVMQVDVGFKPKHAQCASEKANGYKKKVSMLGFSVQTPEQTIMGGLQGVSRGLSSALNRAVSRQDMVLVYESSQHHLYDELTNAPSHYTQQRTITKAVSVSQDMGSQFVISGVIRDLGVTDPGAYSTSYWSKLKGVAGWANKKRRFSVDLFIHDGFSGSIIYQQNFSTVGEWPLDANETIGFGTPPFWDTDYGRAVAILVNDMAAAVSDTLRCQPFMVRISRVDGKTLHFPLGASAGIKPGDKLSLYRTFNFYDADLLAGTELTNLKTVLTVSQVHPGFSSGRINVEPGRLNVQEDDLLIAW